MDDHLERSDPIFDRLTYEEYRKRVQYEVIYFVLVFVSGSMTILNILTNKGKLTIATFGFAVLCVVNYAIMRIFPKNGMRVSAVLFVVEMISLFVFFIVSGNPEGFSAIWIATLPGCGMIMFGRRNTTILCALMLGILIFFFWTPAGGQYLGFEYTATFKQRFPMFFVAFFGLSFFLESLRMATQRELDKAREKNEYMSTHDNLTDMLNRHGLHRIERQSKAGDRQTVVMLDIDFFKKVNDTYGHDAGDKTLQKTAQVVLQILGTTTCRWGGEEFVAWYPEGIPDRATVEELRQAIEDTEIGLPDGRNIKVTISIGAVEGNENAKLETLINRADECLYKAKQTGRNKIVWG